MNRTARAAAVTVSALVLCLPLAFSGCSGGDREAAVEVERQARLAEIEQHKRELDAAREELARMKERLRQGRAGELPAGEAVDEAELQADLRQKDAEITAMAEDVNAELTGFINELAEQGAVAPGEPLPQVMQRAIALKAEEDMTLAREFITEGGDYARAIDMYRSILTFAPDDERVQAALAEAERMRYMDAERFAQVQTGMTQAEVEEVLGPANLRNRREWPDQGIVAWYYPKSDQRDAAGVWFRQRDARWVVYRVDFDAVTSESG